MAYCPEPEGHYRDLLAKQVGGHAEVALPFGRADVMTDTTVWEVEPISRWRTGAAQALQYGAQVPQRGALAVYGSPARLAGVFSELAGLPAPGLELWWFDGGEFILVQTAEQAQSYVPIPEPIPEPELPVPPKWEPTPWEPPAPRPERPRPQFNSAGFEIWWSGTHLESGEFRPELRDLEGDEYIQAIVDHWPDPTQEQLTTLGALFGFAQS